VGVVFDVFLPLVGNRKQTVEELLESSVSKVEGFYAFLKKFRKFKKFTVG
jgi:hypothetical protein